ncbi:MAG TPA: TlpA disulfide reductase family protein [Nocardioidaceae bacterium]|nr:TlpA disulfide reductase family protein [Nocardioidaceae bacterium]
MPRLRRTVPVLALAAATGLLVLSGCSSGIGGSAGSGSGQGYVSGNGAITALPVADREKPGPVSGTTLDGRPLSLSDYAGKVVVVNVWGSWCGDCRAEAAMLSSAARDLSDKGVAFLGIDSRDPSKAAARAYMRHFDVPYPSIYDQSGKTLLAFHGTLTPNSIPSTVIIDRHGRVAASVLGQIDRTTLEDLVGGVSAGSTAGDKGKGPA